MSFLYIDIESRRYAKKFFLPYVNNTRNACNWVLQKQVRDKGNRISHFILYERKTRKVLGLYLFEDVEALNSLDSLLQRITQGRK